MQHLAAMCGSQRQGVLRGRALRGHDTVASGDQRRHRKVEGNWKVPLPGIFCGFFWFVGCWEGLRCYH